MTLPRLTYEQSKRAYELGFAEITNWWLEKDSQKPCHINDMGGVFKNHYANPENQLFLMWCRQKHDLHGWVAESLEHPTYFPLTTHMDRWPIGTLVYLKYPEAETALIDYLLDLLENKTK